MKKLRILILCTGNSCRSQMAEALFKKYGVDKLEVVSAGLEPKPINPLTIEAMQEIGIDISGSKSKSVKEFLGKTAFDYIIFVCDRAERNCPHIYPLVSRNTSWRVSWPLQDPAEATGTKEEKLAVFRTIRDNISELIKKWLVENKGKAIMGSRDKIKMLFLCTGNSCRSQMAEGWARKLKSDVIEAYSAGIETHGLNPYAVKVMAEAGVDISGHKSKLLTDLNGIDFDYVVTVCGHAHETCPFFPAKAKVVHIGFDDPPKLAKDLTVEEEKLNCYRRVRDEIKKFIEGLPSSEITKKEKDYVGQ